MALPSQAEHGITAEIVPAKVRPGDLFELRVEMDRPDYARFALEVPHHERLHRVAVETVPVALMNGRYRQSERWLLQADSSGEIVIDGAMVTLETGDGPVPVKMPPLRVAVVPFEQHDQSTDPVAFPAEPTVGVDRSNHYWWWVTPVLAVVLGFAWWMRRGSDAKTRSETDDDAEWAAALADLDAGMIASPAMERLFAERGDGWPRELHEAAKAAVYAGRGEARALAVLLRKEAAR